MLDEALSRNDSQSRAKIRVAFYQLYQAANLSIMIAPPFVMEEAVKSDDYTSFVDVLYRYYFKEEHYPVEDAREVFDLWAKRVKGFVDRVAAQSKASTSRRPRATRAKKAWEGVRRRRKGLASWTRKDTPPKARCSSAT